MALGVNTTALTSATRGTNDGGFSQISRSLGAIADDAMEITETIQKNRAAQGQKNAQAAFAQGASQAAPGSAVTVDPDANGEKGKFGASEKAYENTLALLTLQRSKRDATVMFDEIAVDTKGNPSEYEKLTQKAISGYIENAPQESRAAIEEELRYKAASGLAARHRERRESDIKEVNAETKASVENAGVDMERLVSTGGVAALGTPEFQRMMTDYAALQDIRENNPDITYTPSQRAADDDALEKRLKSGVFSQEVRNIYNDAQIKADADRANGVDDGSIVSGKEAAYGAIEALVEGLDGTPAEKASLRRTLRADADAAAQADDFAVKKLAAADKAKRDETAANANVAASRGNLTYAQIDAIRDTVGDSNWATLTKSRDRHLEKEREKSAAASEYQAVISGEIPYDPFNSKQTKAMETHYTETEARKIWESGNPVKGTLDYIARTGHLPKSVSSGISGAIMTGTADEQIVAVEMAEHIRMRSAASYAKLPKQVRDISMQASRLIENGIPAETALLNARNALMPQTPQAEIRKAQMTRSFVSKNLVETEAMIVKEMDVEMTDEASANLRVLWENEYMNIGSDLGVEAVNAAVMENFSRTFGPSRMSRGGMMKFPPEKAYGLETLSDKKNAKWMDDQLKEMVHGVTQDLAERPEFNMEAALRRGDLNPSAGEFKSKDNAFAQSAFLVPSPGASRMVDAEGNPIPSYQVFVDPDEDGYPEPLMIDGDVMTFRPNYQTSPEFAKAQAKAKKHKDKQMAKARARRAEMMSADELSPILEEKGQRYLDAASSNTIR